MSFGSQKLVHTDGTMHHLGIDAVTPRVILVPDPQEVPLYAALLEGPVQQGCYREYATWRGIWRGEPLTVMSCGFGCMPMAIAVEELHHLGAESLIKIAACPAIQPELEPGTLLAASGAAAASQIAFEDDLGPLAPAVPLLLAALASRKGQAAAARVSGVLALCLALLYSIIALASLRHVQAAWCRPWGSAADAGLSLCLCLTPACLLFLDGDGQTPRPGWSALAAAVLPGVAALLCSACLSPAWTAQLPQPLYTLTKSLSVLSVMQRFELLLSTAQLLGLVSLLTLLVCAAARTAEVCLGAEWGEKKEGVFCLLAFGVSFLTQRLPMAVWVVGAATFWGVIPILTQVIGNIKKNEK